MRRVWLAAVLLVCGLWSVPASAIDAFSNSRAVTVSTGYDAAATTIVLTAGEGAAAGLPTTAANYSWWNSTQYNSPDLDPNWEIIRCTRSTDTLTCTRAAEAANGVTTAFAHNSPGRVYKLLATLTAKTLNTDITAAIGTPVQSVTGTANQVIVTGTTTPTLSLPQSVATTSTPTFAAITAPDKGGQVYNVKAYGATGDGTTNDAAAIASAITAAGTNGHVYFPAGTYLVSTSVQPLAGQTLEGAGPRVAFLKQGGVGTTGTIYINAVAAVSVRSLGFLGHATTHQPAIVVNAATDAAIEDVYNDVNNARLVLLQAASHRGRVSRSYSAGTTSSNIIEFNGSNYCVAEFNTLIGGNGAVEIYQPSMGVPIYGTRVIGNHMDGGNAGVVAVGDQGTVIQGNTIINMVTNGILARKGEIDTAVLSLNGKIIGNTIKSSGGTTIAGIVLDPEARYWTVIGNDVESSGGGIFISGVNNTVTGNTFSLNTLQGISTTPTGSNNIIASNTVFNNSQTGVATTDGIQISGDTNTISNNVSTGTNQRYGLLFVAGGDTNLHFQNNLAGNATGTVLDNGTNNGLLTQTKFSSPATMVLAPANYAVAIGAADSTRAGLYSSGVNLTAIRGDFLVYTPFGASLFKLPTIGMTTWTSSGTDPTGTVDTGIGRNAAGVVEVNNGTLGTLRDLKARTLNPTTSYQVNGTVAISVTAPTATTFCTSPSVPANNGTAAFTVNVGTSCSTSVGTITLPTATTGWVVDCRNVTNPAANVPSQTGGTTATATLTNYVRTTGVAGNWTDSDVLRCKAMAY